MKKSVPILAALCAVTAAALTGCGSPEPKSVDNSARTSDTVVTEKPHSRRDIVEIEIGGFSDGVCKLPISGIRRRFNAEPDFSGTYTVEYVHRPRDEQPDETLDYRLELKNDNTYGMTVTADGVTAEHYGHWYAHRGGDIIMYYDEPLDPTAHNVYVSDSMYGEILPHGKIMIYDNCNVIVLARETAPAPEITDTDNAA